MSKQNPSKEEVVKWYTESIEKAKSEEEELNQYSGDDMLGQIFTREFWLMRNDFGNLDVDHRDILKEKIIQIMDRIGAGSTIRKLYYYLGAYYDLHMDFSMIYIPPSVLNRRLYEQFRGGLGAFEFDNIDESEFNNMLDSTFSRVTSSIADTFLDSSFDGYHALKMVFVKFDRSSHPASRPPHIGILVNTLDGGEVFGNE